MYIYIQQKIDKIMICLLLFAIVFLIGAYLLFIKDIINIDIEGRKDRTNTEFLSYKNKIYDYFFEDRNKNAVEYNI